jgi:hypothetical protein
MGLISNGTTIFDAGAIDSGIAKGALTFIKKLTASSSGTLSFVNGASNVVLDSTYKEYLFTFNNIHPGTNNVIFSVNFRDGGSNYDAPKTTTWFNAYHNEDGGSAGVSYNNNGDLAQSTAGQYLGWSMYNDNDQSASGYLHLFNPSSTTFVKHFIARVNNYYDNGSADAYVAGYCNTTTAIDGVQFAMSSGNIDAGDICLYGIS